MSRRDERRREIEVVREEARVAARAGKSIHSCPYRDCNSYQWRGEFMSELDRMAREAEEAEEREREDELSALIGRINGITTLADLKECLIEIVKKSS